jgi:multiple sugar transport system permease protein
MIIARAKRRSAVVAPSRQRSKIDWSAYLYILPAGLLLGVFGLWPIVFGFWISLWRWGISPERFVGLRNYQRILIDDIVTKDYRGHWTLGEVGQSLVATIYYVIGTVPLSIGIAFVVAYLLFEGTPLRDFWRRGWSSCGSSILRLGSRTTCFTHSGCRSRPGSRTQTR